MDPNSSSYPALKFLNGFAEIQKSRQSLPHWQQDSAAYFLTFRLADSIPSALLRVWKKKKDQWLREHPKPWSSETESEFLKNYSGRIERHLDQGAGSCLLAKPDHAETVSSVFAHFDRIRYLIHAWVIMPNHVHALVSLEKEATSGKPSQVGNVSRRHGSTGPRGSPAQCGKRTILTG